MKIIFIGNVFGTHQIAIWDAFNALSGVQVTFIEAEEINKSQLAIGYQTETDRKYVINYSYLISHKQEIENLIDEAEIVIVGGWYGNFVKKRLKQRKITYIYSERIFKNIICDIKTPHYYRLFRKQFPYRESLYILGASAYAANDYIRIGVPGNKIFKWGYFINPPESFNNCISEINELRILWCARFIKWKHPEIAIKMAQSLRDNGIKFKLDMYGTGELEESAKELIDKLDLNDLVSLKGTIANSKMVKEMQKYNILIITSDRNEGWGAVVNEAMGNGCVVVGSNAVGSIPFLIKHCFNGLIFKDQSIKSLVNQIKYLASNREEVIRLSRNAYQTINTVWSPQNAAANLLQLTHCLLNERNNTVAEGPCSNVN